MFKKNGIFALIVAAALAVSPYAVAQWTVKSYTDPMTDETSVSAWSATTPPNNPVGFPYDDLSASLLVDCGNRGRQVRLSFNQNVIIGGMIREYLDIVNISIYKFNLRMRFNDWPAKTVPFGTQPLGNSNPRIVRANTDEGPPLIASIKSAKKVLVEVPLEDSGTVYFTFDLTGAEKAIDEALAGC